MLVSDVLDKISSGVPRKIITCEASESVGSAIAKIAERNIGAVVVSDGGHVAGVFSERDVAKGVHAHGTAFIDMELRRAMVKKVIIISPTQSVDDALSLMKDNNIRHLPVVADNKLIGIVSMRDLMLSKLDYVNNTVEFLKDQVQIAHHPLPM